MSLSGHKRGRDEECSGGANAGNEGLLESSKKADGALGKPSSSSTDAQKAPGNTASLQHRA